MEILKELVEEMNKVLKNWNIKGIIDSDKNIYTVSQDTKLLSKIFELYVTPILYKFADKHNLEIEPAQTQIQYPDYSLRGEALGLGDKWLALDLKSTTRDSEKPNRIGGFTLGSFRGALRNPTSTQYSRFPYNDYGAHWCLCFIYTRTENVNEHTVYTVDSMDTIPDAVENVEVYLQEKYKLAWHTPGSGNTANIGSVKTIYDIEKGSGPFSKLGEVVFEDYWRNYLRKEDAKQLGLDKQPYNNIQTYLDWKNKEE